jgi:hypothetical protein
MELESPTHLYESALPGAVYPKYTPQARRECQRLVVRLPNAVFRFRQCRQGGKSKRDKAAIADAGGLSSSGTSRPSSTRHSSASISPHLDATRGS